MLGRRPNERMEPEPSPLAAHSPSLTGGQRFQEIARISQSPPRCSSLTEVVLVVVTMAIFRQGKCVAGYELSGSLSFSRPPHLLGMIDGQQGNHSPWKVQYCTGSRCVA